MGWFGNSAPTPSKPEATQDSVPAHSPPAQPPQSQPKAAASSDDVEVAEFLKEMMAEVKSVRQSLDASKAAGSSDNAADSSPSSTTAPSTKSTWTSRWATSAVSSMSSFSSAENKTTSSELTEDIPDSQKRLSPLAESLLPTEMNCEQAFNLAYYCQSLGGQFTSLYRYGGMRSCSENWNDFWFCMRVKSYPAGEVKDNMIREHYRNKELAKYGPGKPSSEDVWRERRSRVKPGEALSSPLEEQQQPMSDAEFQKWEMERYERIRKELKEGERSASTS